MGELASESRAPACRPGLWRKCACLASKPWPTLSSRASLAVALPGLVDAKSVPGHQNNAASLLPHLSAFVADSTRPTLRWRGQSLTSGACALPSSVSPSCRGPRQLSLQTTDFPPGPCLRFHTWAHRQIHLVGFSEVSASCLVPQEYFQRFRGSLEICFFESVLGDPGSKPGCKMHVPSQAPQMHILLGCRSLVKCFPETLPAKSSFSGDL